MIAGPVCPACESDGPHNILEYGYDEDGMMRGAEIVHCMTCETVWDIRYE